MRILLLAVASFPAFVSIVLLLCVSNALETRQTCGRSEIHVRPSFNVLSITQAFEPVFSVLWAAPSYALELIQSGGTRGIPVCRLRSTFNEAAARFPEIYDGFNFRAMAPISRRRPVRCLDRTAGHTHLGRLRVPRVSVHDGGSGRGMRPYSDEAIIVVAEVDENPI